MKRANAAVIDRLRQTLAVSVRATALAHTSFDDNPPERLAVERGAAWAVVDEAPNDIAFTWIEPLLADNCDVEETEIVDRAGHRRPAYLGLLLYAMFQTLRSSDRVLVAAPAATAVRHIESLVDLVQASINQLNDGFVPAAQGDVAAALAWESLALFAGGELLHDDRLLRIAARGVRTLLSRQQPNGGYLLSSAADNPETGWLHELQILHAVTSFGLQAGDAAALTSAAKAAMWHLNETQPDHATNQPWGLPAFLIDPQTHIMADAMIHAAAVEQPERLSGATLILLADALYSWRRR